MGTNRKLRFYSLLYIELDETRLLQGKKRKDKERIDIFVRNAAMLDKSLTWFSPQGLTLLTNAPEALCNSFKRVGHEIRYEKIDFDIDGLPKDIPFYSAHFKIDAFRYLGSRPDDEYSVLLDNDMVQLRPFPKVFNEIVEKGIPTCYYLTIKDKIDEAVDSCREADKDLPIMQWTGGEYWGGVNRWYKTLYKSCKIEIPKYLAYLHMGQYHIGDEMITTMALAKIKNDVDLIDISHYNIVKRYWGMHETESLEYFKPVISHLPADKIWLAGISIDSVTNSADFLKKYKRHWFKFRIIQRLRSMLGR